MTLILITVGALGLMYFCCIWPMRRGHGAAARSCCSVANADAHGSDAQPSREAEALRKSMSAAGPAPARVSVQS